MQIIPNKPSEKLFLDCILNYYIFLSGGQLNAIEEVKLKELKT